MTNPPHRRFWREFWPKTGIVVAVVAGLWLLEHYGLIRRW